MPQLDLSTFATQAFWMVLCFTILWLLLSVFITPKIADILEQRKRKIDDYIRKAEKLNKRAKESIDRYENALAEAKKRAASDLAKTQQDLADYIEKEEAQMAERLNQKMAENELLLAKEKKETLRQAEHLSQTLALDIVQKLGFSQINMQDITETAEESKKK